MSLIEGLGDEVTLVMGAVLVCVMLAFAWLSTHTTELPALREVGITVIERTQIRRRVANADNHEHSTDNSGLTDVVEFVAVSGNSLENEDNNVMSSQETSSTSAENAQGATSSPYHENLLDCGRSNAEVSGIQVEEASTVDGILQLASGAENQLNRVKSSEGEEEGSMANIVKSIKASPELVHSQPTKEHPAEAEIRRRRVQYFQSSTSGTLDLNHANSGAPCLSELNHNLAHMEASTSPFESSSIQSNSSISTASAQTTNSPHNSSVRQPVLLGTTTDEHSDASLSVIRIKLKYMNETHRLVHASPLDTIGHFRRTHFQQELQEGDKWVRFIFNGQDLRNDEATLQAYQIGDNCTMHCLITNKRLSPSGEGSSGGGGSALRGVDEEDNDSVMGALMYPLFTLVLVVVWYFRLTYRQYFSPMSTVCLIGISFLLGLGYFSSLRTTASATSNQQPNSASGRESPADQRQTNQPIGRRHAHAD